MRQFGPCTVSLIVLFIFTGCNKPSPAGFSSGEIDASADPEQVPVQAGRQFIIRVNNGKFLLTPIAGYSISGIVVGKKSYSYGWQAKLAPVDLALAWGELAAPGAEDHVSFSQSDRWYFFTYRENAPVSASYISTHSSNNHIIPANENIRSTVHSIEESDRVTLRGFLVNAKGTYDTVPYRWNTSLSRKDTGDGSCEVFYVTQVRVGEYVYE